MTGKVPSDLFASLPDVSIATLDNNPGDAWNPLCILCWLRFNGLHIHTLDSHDFASSVLWHTN
jgi:hypothetical protein